MIKSSKIALLAAAGAMALTVSAAKAWNEGGGEQDEATVAYQTFKDKTPEELEKIRADGLAVFEVCSACHMPEGWGSADGTFPQIAGQRPEVIIKQLADIRALNRDNPTMYPFALPKEIEAVAPEVGGGPYAIAAVSYYISHMKMNPEPGVGAGDDLEHGAQLYKDNCVRCHGDQGQGDNEKFYPRIQGQHYEYLLRQFVWIKEGKRRNANPDMVKQINDFTEQDTKAVLDYVSRLKPDAEMLAPVGYINPDFD